MASACGCGRVPDAPSSPVVGPRAVPGWQRRCDGSRQPSQLTVRLSGGVCDRPVVRCAVGRDVRRKTADRRGSGTGRLRREQEGRRFRREESREAAAAGGAPAGGARAARRTRRRDRGQAGAGWGVVPRRRQGRAPGAVGRGPERGVGLVTQSPLPGRRRSIPAQIMIGMIRAYQRFGSPLFGGRCRFYPSCSEYAVQAIGLHGPWRGSALAARRLARCHPFHPGGVDHVPPAPEARHGGIPERTAEASGVGRRKRGSW